ncbi:hypothetical protein [Alphaentomopoxvirus acuprea]|uniref:Uncharacterized protein n=1 Tax=Alphaentomopoxvirus acuprea TaxID=62099 RepID=W6JKU3_9POXV|nr:hypothetical protein BA82_gp045 [Anomala cuprea entomopoxvirus]BAO49405.1 hypothetical protein [Anomala cuprea entomopoxvirus]
MQNTLPTYDQIINKDNHYTYPRHWDSNNLYSKSIVLYNKHKFNKIYKKYNNIFKNNKDIYVKFKNLKSIHKLTFHKLYNNTYKYNNFNTLLHVEKLIYTNIYLIKLKYIILKSNNLYIILGAAYIVNYIFNKNGINIDDSNLLELIFNCIDLDSLDILNHIHIFRINILNNINKLINDIDDRIKMGIINYS